MSKKIPLGVALAAIIAVAAITVGVTVKVFTDKYNEVLSDFPQRAERYSQLTDIDELVRNNYFGQADSDLLDFGIVRGYIDGLNDEYSCYFSKSEYETYYNSTLGKMSGTGLSVVFDKKEQLLKVSGVAESSPAYEAGIVVGDIIQTVDKKQPDENNYSEILKLLTSETSASVNVTVSRRDENGKEEGNFTAKLKSKYEVKSCTYSKDGTVGYIRLSEFYENTAEAFSEAVQSLSDEGIAGLIIDLRNNASNNLEYATEVIDRIVPMATEGTGEIATTKNSAGKTLDVYSSDSSAINLPMAVLINDRTEGVAELVACDLRDFGKAKLFGETTAGHGTLQKIFKLNDGSAVLLTVAKIYPYISDCYDGTGVVPNETVIMSAEDKGRLSSLDKKNDVQYKAALEYFS